MYDIATYFSEVARRVAAYADYQGEWKGFCPIGVMLLIDGYEGKRRPLATETANAYLGSERTAQDMHDESSEVNKLMNASWEFAYYWDNELRFDLTEALGVK